MLSVFTKAIPPLLLTGLAFLIAGIIGTLYCLISGIGFSSWRQPIKVYLHAIYGLFLYHLCFFLAMRFLPPATAVLINALWPLLIVLFSAFLPHGRLRMTHLIGSLLGLLALYFLVGTLSFGTSPYALYGILCATACALIWSSYSVLANTLPHVPTSAMGAFCLLTSLISLCASIFLETPRFDFTSTQIIAIILMGTGPTGLAFYFWDYAMKKGDVALIGALSYAAPVGGTVLLVLFGFDKFTPTLLFSCGLIVIGSIIASLKPSSRDDGTHKLL